MALPPVLQRPKLPVIGAPMFIAGNPKLAIEQCKAGIVGSFPALNARPKEALDRSLTERKPGWR
jgi:nitronate monooxygenase